MSGVTQAPQRILLFDLAAAITHSAADATTPTVRARIPIVAGTFVLAIEAALGRGVSGTTATLAVRATAPGGAYADGAPLGILQMTGTAKNARGQLRVKCGGSTYAPDCDFNTSFSSMTATATPFGIGFPEPLSSYDVVFATFDSVNTAFTFLHGMVEMRRNALQSS